MIKASGIVPDRSNDKIARNPPFRQEEKKSTQKQKQKKPTHTKTCTTTIIVGTATTAGPANTNCIHSILYAYA